MSDDNIRTIAMDEGEKAFKVKLPREIGYVEIRTDGVGPDGDPVIGVDVVSQSERQPASDHYLYYPRFDRDCTVLLVARPGPRMLEQRRQVEWFASIIKKHDAGDHFACPETCPVRMIEQEHEHVFEDSEPNGMCIADMDCIVTYGQYKAAPDQ